jgi:biotin operon repressor
MNNIIGETKYDILKLLADEEYSQISLRTLGDIVGVEKPTVQDHIDDLEDQGLITVDDSPKLTNIKKLTREGYRIATCTKRPYTLNKDDYDHGEIRLHKFIVEFKIQNRRELDDGWIERYMASEPVSYQYNPEDGNYWVHADKYNFRISNEKIWIHVKEIRGIDTHNVKHRGFATAFDARDWLENNSPVSISSKPHDTEIHVNEQHISLVKDPFALAVNQSPLDLDEVRICDKDTGEVRLKIDKSVGVPELESENLQYGEEDINQIRSFYDTLIHSDDGSFKELPDKVEKLEKTVNQLEQNPQKTTLGRELEYSSKWVDNHGNLMGWSTELEKPVKIIPKEEL